MGENMLSPDLSTSASNNRVVAKEVQEEFKYYFYYVLFKKKGLILLLSLLGIIITVLSLYLTTPLYKATSKILVRSNVSQEVILFNDLYRQPARITNTIPANNFIEIATSNNIARIIVKRFKLDEKLKRQMEEPENFRENFWCYFNKTLDGIKSAVKYPYRLYKEKVLGEEPSVKEVDYTVMAVNKFLNDMTEIDLVAESDIIILTIWDDSPREAEAIVKELTNLVIEKSISMEQHAAGYGYEFARDELVKARQDLAVAEEKVQQFKERWNISKIDRQKEIKLDELDQIEKQLTLTNADLSAQQARLAEGKRQLNVQKKALTSLDAYKNLLNESILLKVEIKALKAKKLEYERAKSRIEASNKELVSKELELTQLNREVGLKEHLYDQLGKKHDELNVQSVSNLGGFDLRVIDMPELPDRLEPDYPSWEVGLGVGIPAIILLSILIAFLLELLNESFWIGDQIEKKLGIPLLGTIRLHEIKLKK
ncbi:MAG: hypothetical protein JRG97_05635 [Deltaproteobacteria bacterium]|nr:hypothetical protein [Deltaproteobacteria bacterium]MBW2140540.1 hypothetical protein [Deltaproteobacteria bacterium]MBW2322461.1 hypothetical protein [Deltaproteobacteria bacterium]